MPMIMKILEASSSLEEDRVRASWLELDLAKVNVELVLSLLGACMARKVKEGTGVGRVKIVVKAYGDIDRILEGEESIEYLEFTVEASCTGGVGVEDVRRAAEECPVYGLIKGYVKKLEVKCV